MEKIVSQIDHEGYFCGAVIADPSPLEDGVYLIPGGCIDLAPPMSVVGKRYKPNGSGGWLSEEIPATDQSPAPLTDAQLAAASVAEMQRRLDSHARSWGYDDIKSAVGYVGDPFAQFDAEGTVLRNWRSACWQWARLQEALVLEGSQVRPVSPEAFADAMPAAPARP